MSDQTHPYIKALAVMLSLAAGVPTFLGDDEPLADKLVNVLNEGQSLRDRDSGPEPSTALSLMQRISGILNQLRDKGYTIEPDKTYKAPDFAEMRRSAAEKSASFEDANKIVLERRRNELDAKVEMLSNAFSLKNAELIDEANALSGAVEMTDAELRASMLIDFAVRGEKQIDDGLSVRINTDYDFEDKDAVAFAIDRKMPELLKPDRTSFKKQMKLTPQPFCEVSQTASTVVSLKPKETE